MEAPARGLVFAWSDGGECLHQPQCVLPIEAFPIEQRQQTIEKIARELGRADVNAFMKRLFRERSWGDMAESETYAHLEHLRMAGKAAAFRRRTGAARLRALSSVHVVARS
ncbi:MAG: hypothetical protein HC933_09190, partial [Pleurocapsa sp. SU_196_0]|nr:hypothetical protein [Pleurocapsa sp. SU_196_0]